MRRTFESVTVIVLAFFVMTPFAWAQKDSITFKGELNNQFTGSCGVNSGFIGCATAYNAICQSGSCGCEQHIGTATGHVIGKDTAAEMDITFDGGDSVGGVGICRPFSGSLCINGTKDVEQVDFNGSSCDPLTAKGKNSEFNGGFGVTSSTNSISDFGIVSGTLGFLTTTDVVHFKGASCAKGSPC